MTFKVILEEEDFPWMTAMDSTTTATTADILYHITTTTTNALFVLLKGTYLMGL